MSETAALDANEAMHALDTETLQFLTFTLGQDEYGVDIMSVREIKAWSDVTRLPNAPKFMLGVMNLRGLIIPIFDLRARFSGEFTQTHPKNVIIVVALEKRLIGILVDAVSDIVDTVPGEIKPPPSADLNIDERYVHGLISLKERMIVVLDIEHLFDKEALAKMPTHDHDIPKLSTLE